MDILKSYSSYEETLETQFTIIIYDKPINDIINYLEDHLNKAKNITNPIKKNKINNRLFSLIEYLKQNYDENYIINNIFLINDKIVDYKLNKTEINTCETYKFSKIIYKIDFKFLIDYIVDLFTNFHFIYSIKINKNEAVVNKFNRNKELEEENYKSINENKINEIIENIRKNNNYKDIIFICGGNNNNNNLLSKINLKDIILQKEIGNKDQLYELYENELMKKNHILLQKRLDDMKNDKTNIDLYVFGKLKIEIKDAIESYSIKELYIEEKKLNKLKEFVDSSFFNFKIIIIKILEENDVANLFIKNYNGIMGIKYY